MEEVINQNIWIFELDNQESFIVPLWIIIGFQKRDRQNFQNLNNDTSCRLSVTSAQRKIELEKCPDAGILLNYVDDDYSQGYAEIKECFRALLKEDIFQAYLLDDDIRSSKTRADDVGCKFFVFDVRYRQKFTASQPTEVEINFEGVVPNNTNGYALVLTNKLASISSDGQRHFDLIKVIYNFFKTL